MNTYLIYDHFKTNNSFFYIFNFTSNSQNINTEKTNIIHNNPLIFIIINNKSKKVFKYLYIIYFAIYNFIKNDREKNIKI